MSQHPYNPDCRCTGCLSIERNQGKPPVYQPPEFKYSRPDTSDRRSDESWTEYWDRKRHERHGPNCGCLLCLNEEELKELGERLWPSDMRRWVE